MLKKMMLKHKLISAFVAVGLIPISVIAIVIINTASTSIEQLAFNQLESVQIIKKSQIISYFNERMNDAKMFSQIPFIENAIEELNVLSREAADNNFKGQRVLKYEPYKRVYDKHLKFIKSYLETNGYYDIFLFAPNTGKALLTVALESDFATEMKDESHSLARAWQEANRSNKPVLTDMEPYAPSFGAPAMFMVVPVIINGRNIGAIGMQISNDQINGIMLERSGMGKTGETYLVGKDKLMRSDSFIDPSGHSVKESFKGNVENNGVNTAASNKALAGEEGKDIIIDYNGNQVLSVYGPVTFYGITWALIAEIDQEEALASSIAMIKFSTIVWVLLLILVIIIGAVISKSIKPLFRLANKLEVLTSKEGNLSEKLPESGNNEIGILAQLFNKFIESLKYMVINIKESGMQVSTSTSQITASTKQLEATVSENVATTNQIVSAAKEISTTSLELVNTMKSVSELSEKTAASAEEGNSAIEQMDAVMKQLNESLTAISDRLSLINDKAANISKIISTIEKISDQTNLLSLNAAIESEKAGEYGKGFAVVAREMRKLADRTDVATLDIQKLVKEMKSAVSEGVMSMDKFTVDVHKGVEEVSVVSRVLSRVIDQVQELIPKFEIVNDGVNSQSQGAELIKESVIQINEAAKQTADALNETSGALRQLNDAAANLEEEVGRFKT